MATILNCDFHYETHKIRVSKLINDNCSKIGEQAVNDSDSERIEKLQKYGNELRAKFGNNILSEYAIEIIHGARENDELAENVRKCWIIDSLKHPEEAAVLNEVYGDCFWLIAVFAPEDVRLKRLKDLHSNLSYIEQIKKTDFDEGSDVGQSVKDVLPYADMFIRNDKFNKVSLEASVRRFLDLIFGIGINTPTRHESAMLAAEAQSARSACLSRRVGAIIISAEGEQIGQGCNDVPKYHGGIYESEPHVDDNRCYNWVGQICHNDKHKEIIYDQIEKIVNAEKLDEFRKLISRTDIKNLIEFSRAVHAEMEAILSVARAGKSGLIGSSLYSTTFPCHSCARHIVASGVSHVFYIEAYPKSLALDLHHDTISTLEADEGKKVLFLQYEGASPKGYNRVFSIKSERKKAGKLIHLERATARPMRAPPIDGLATREKLAMARFKRLEEGGPSD
ncbi:anti-phage dCTP deaminase [Methylocapsa polymorpha]|uniref:Anti-phage dCTP deaminase n=1 Tax=Methylocapsa polymorpha TaxID=3080828 RepID=A0ABZ0HWK3_9HYPH|nr:anti-phage dCTP deaminase [Methylocapsa sp. RX1]